MYFRENNVEHDGLEYEEFAENFNKHELINIDFNNKTSKRYYIIHTLIKNLEIDLNTIYKKVYDDKKNKLVN